MIETGGLALSALSDLPTGMRTAARQFCLDVIKEFYGFDYREEWHRDLDSLLLDEAGNHYSAANRGAFWLLTDTSGQIVATAGVRALSWKPELETDLGSRYPDFSAIGSLWRVYIRKDLRRQGIGRMLASINEDGARALGYGCLYLHASTGATDTMAFWESCGYRPFGTIDFSTHFDKRI